MSNRNFSSEQSTDSKAVRYHAFISYRHADNKEDGRRWASWMHHALETFEIPADLVGTKNQRGDVIPERIFPIFRDEDELPADADLGGAITRALDRTEFLIVLCSPKSVASKYVADEIDYFKSLGNSDRVMAAIIDGEPNVSWDHGKQDLGFQVQQECFPIPLQFQYIDNKRTSKRAEPIAADFRFLHEGRATEGWTNPAYCQQWLGQNTSLSKQQIKATVLDYEKQLKLMLVKIVAGIIGVSLGELTQRDKAYRLEQEKRKAAKLRGWLMTITAMAVLAISAGFYALAKKEQAEQLLVEANNNIGVAYLESAKKALNEKNHLDARFLSANSLLKLDPSQSFSEITTAKSIYALSKQFTLKPSISTKNKTGNDDDPLSHSDTVRSLAYSPDGTLLASASEDKTIKLRRVKTDELMFSLEGHSAFVSDVEFSPDGKLLASASGDQTIKCWDVNTGELIVTLKGHTKAVLGIAFSSNGQTLASSSFDGTVKIWNISDGKEIKTFNQWGVSEVVFSPDGAILAASGLEGTKLWNMASLSQHEIQIEDRSMFAPSVAFSPNNQVLASVYDKSINLYDLSSGELLHSLAGHFAAVESISYDSKGETLISASADKTLKLWSVSTGSLITTIKGHSDAVRAVAISPLNDVIASGSADKTIQFWKIPKRTLQKSLKGHRSNVSNLSLLKSKNSLIASTHSSAILWHLPSGNIITDFSEGGAYQNATFSPDSSLLAFSDESSIMLWNLRTNEEINLQGHTDTILGLAFSSDSKTLVSASSDKTIKAWDVATRSLKASFIGHADPVFSAVTSPDEKLIASSSGDNTVKIWDIATSTEIATLTGHSSSVYDVAFSPNGKVIATASYDRTVKLWDRDYYSETKTLSGHKDSVHAVKFSPDGRTLATASRDNTIILWDLQSHNIIHTLVGHTEGVYSIVFSQNGNMLYSGSGDKTVKVWNLSFLDDYYKLNNQQVESWLKAVKQKGANLVGFDVEFNKTSAD